MRSRSRTEEFVAFTAAHRRDLVRTATLLCAGDAAHAEDVVQITLTRLFLAWTRVRRADSPLAYARRSLTNAFLDEAGRAHRRRESVAADPRTAAAEPAASPEDVVLRRLVLDALATLAPRQRAVVVLRHWHDLDVAQTAEALGCSTGTVKSQNARALAHLRSVLEAAPDVLEALS
ncbi:SigE family RNA polymerase sigma factor [Microbacterium sp. ARD31]|uniref:SigE family RNA polymerase sigma factor n=1 Tax=Microbacterium sp. ARD31 TaxID=2962576 RepID=UPI002881D663|nr:SigE family RNA polymerase sigma factor [Microbacterium sp. ARD31]MDT0182851.1 SigE family RNA polymerase sigma factor [Microbacterium sp. ARD31]